MRIIDNMNPKKWLVAVAVVLPIILFGAAKWATRWRPIAIGRFDGAPGVEGASDRYLDVSGTLLDLNTGAQTHIKVPSGAAGGWIWSVETRGHPHLTLIKEDTSLTYSIPRLSKSNKSGWNDWTFVAATAITPERNCVQLFLGNRYYQWNLQSRHLEREFQTPVICQPFCAFSRDGQTLIQAGRYAVATFSTRTGRTLTYRPGNPKLQFGMATFGISAYGSYIIAHNLDNNFDVEQTRTGHVLWQIDPISIPVFSPDEAITALPLQEKGLWEIREAKTGHLVRTLISTPGIPNYDASAFSPDNSTLYYVANGVIYRQRIR